MTRSISCSRPMTGSSFVSRASCVSRARTRRAPASASASSAADSTGRRGAPASPGGTSSRRAPSDSRILAAIDWPSFMRPQEQVLGPDVIVTKLARLFDGQFEHALGLRREGNFNRTSASLGSRRVRARPRPSPSRDAVPGACNTAVAIPSPSRMRPRSTCSVPDESRCRNRPASSRARMMTRRARSVNRSNTGVPHPFFRVAVKADFALGDA